MAALWILLIVGAYQLGRYGLASFFGIDPVDPENQRAAVADKWAARCIAEDKKATHTGIHVVKPKNLK
jgi:hypothetical protein